MPEYNSEWTLFLDRDGVINKRLPGKYVRKIEEFEFLPLVPQAIARFSLIFGRIIVVTNQQGIGKQLMTEAELEVVHKFMFQEIEKSGGIVEAVYFCPDLKTDANPCRKPSPCHGTLGTIRFP